MIKNMDVKIRVQAEDGNLFRFLDFAGEKFLIGMLPEKNLNKKDVFLNSGRLPCGISAAFITGTPDEWLHFGWALFNHNLNNKDGIVNVHISKNSYSLIKSHVDKKTLAARSAGNHNEAKNIEETLKCFIVHNFNEKFQSGGITLEFICQDNNPMSAALRICNASDSILVAQASAYPESFIDKNLKTDILFINVPMKYKACHGEKDAQQPINPVSLEQLAAEINEAKKNLGLFFIPSEIYNIPLIIKALNSMQDKGLISPEIRICPVGTETKEVIRLYEECGMTLNYGNTDFRNLNAASLLREADLSFRIFITPGEDLSDIRYSFSASLYSFVKGNPAAAMAYPSSFLPSGILSDNADCSHCKVILCDILGTPEGKSVSSAMRQGSFSSAVITGNSLELCGDAAASVNDCGLQALVLPHGKENISFYRNGDNKATGYKNSETCVLAAYVGPDMDSFGLSSENILKKFYSSDESIKFGKIVFICDEKFTAYAEKLRQDTVEKTGVPAETAVIPENCGNAERFFVSMVADIIENHKETALFAGGSTANNIWMHVISMASGKKVFYPSKNGIISSPEIPVKFDSRQVLAYWPKIRRIEGENCRELLKSVPEELANIALHYDSAKDRYSFTEYGLIIDVYVRSGKAASASAAPLWSKASSADELPKAVVFTIGKTLLSNYIKQKCGGNRETQVSKENLVSFIQEDSENAFRRCCQELETLFSLPDPKMLKSCRKVFFIALDNKEEKVISEAFEEFFGTIGIEAETIFIEPFENLDEYSLNSLGLREMSSALFGLKKTFGKLLFLLCGNYYSLNFNACIASMLFKDQSYILSEKGLERMPALPLDIDIYEYSGMIGFMDIMADLNLQDRYEKLPEAFKETIVHKTGRGMYFTALKPLFDGAVYAQNPDRLNVRIKDSGSGTLMRGAEKGKMPQPFFIVKKHNE